MSVSLQLVVAICVHAMDRRTFVVSIAASFAGARCGTAADQRMAHIGFLSPAAQPGPNHRAFVDQLARLGWVEGKNLHIEWRWLRQRYDELQIVAEDLARAQLRLIVAQTQAVALALTKATNTTPIVFVGVRDPVAANIVRSLNRPGGNVTGVTLAPTGDIVAKQYEILREITPTLAWIAVLWNPDAPVQANILMQIKSIGDTIGIAVVDMPISRQGDIEKAFDGMADGKPDAVITLVDSFSLANRSLIADLAIKGRLITSFEVKDYVGAGGLVSYGLPYLDHYARGAIFVSRILNGTPPKDLPVEQPTKYELAINLKTAKQIGLEIPATLLARADEVIE